MLTDAEEQATRERHFVEEVGLVFSEMGAPRMTGRVLGRLLVCDPPHQSSAELAEYLDASRGAISTTTRQLIAANILERVAVPGERATYFRIQGRGWVAVMKARFAFLRIVRELADQGLEILADAPAGRRARLEEFRDLYAFLEERWPEIFEEWAARRAGGASEPSSR